MIVIFKVHVAVPKSNNLTCDSFVGTTYGNILMQVDPETELITHIHTKQTVYAFCGI